MARACARAGTDSRVLNLRPEVAGYLAVLGLSIDSAVRFAQLWGGPFPMQKIALRAAFVALFAPLAAHAAEAAAPTGWHAQSLGQAIAYLLLFSLIGIAVAILGYRLFDKFTPGDLHREIVENKNVAAAIVGGAVILGVCIIVAAAMIG